MIDDINELILAIVIKQEIERILSDCYSVFVAFEEVFNEKS